MVFFVTNIPPHYRKSLWYKLLEDKDIDAHFFYGKDENLNIKEIDFSEPQFMKHSDKLHRVKIRNLLRGRVWQRGIISACLTKKLDYVIFIGASNYISNWVAAIICRIRGVGVAFWGHGLKGNEQKYNLFRQKSFFKLADSLVLYERRAKENFIKEGFSADKLYVIFNSLNYDAHLKLRNELNRFKKRDAIPFFKKKELPTLVFIGRLTPVKKLEVLLDAAQEINNKKVSVNVLIIGDGDQRHKLEEIAKNGIKDNWIHFVGECYDEEEIGRYLYFSDLCVSPGNVGLTAIHSLSLGTPVCSHNNFENQMPEVQSITDGYNGFYFEEDDSDDLSGKISDWLLNATDREMIRKRCYKIVDDYYNPYYQRDVFKRVVHGIKPEI